MTTSSTTQIAYNPDLTQRALDNLLHQYKQPRMIAFISALAEGAQVLEDQSFDLLTGSSLEYATGVTLNKWGELVGEGRDGLSDTDYRRFIKARILANKSSGKVEELLTIFGLITAPSRVTYSDIYPACFSMYAFREDYMQEATRNKVRHLMDDIKPAGIAMEIIEVPVGYLGFAADPSALGYSVGRFARVI